MKRLQSKTNRTKRVKHSTVTESFRKKQCKPHKKEQEMISDDDDLPLKQASGITSDNLYNGIINNFRTRSDRTQTMGDNHSPLDLCCCCLELFCLKNLWVEHEWMGQVEIYGKMLKECFDIRFPKEWHAQEKICELCITTLRNSARFKRQVVMCQAKLAEKLTVMGKQNRTDAEPNAVKMEEVKLTIDIIVPQGNTYKSNNCTAIGNENQMDNTQLNHANNEGNCDDIYEDEQNGFSDTNENELQQTKPNKQIKKDLKLTRKAIKNIDRRTLSAHRSDYVKPRQNIGLLLEHSTVLPFKSNKGYFNCLYCNKQYIVFDELRAHVLNLHKDIGFKSILKNILRPHDRIKADISDLTCRHCGDKSQTLPKLIEHLESHSIKFNYEEKLLKPTDCVLPYNLSNGKYKCSVCDSEFPFFKTLTKHMNDHSTNYVCDVCGKCFLLQERLRAHVTIHVSTAAVSCEHCGKICPSNAHLRSHKRHHHKKRSHVCCICNKSFATFKERMLHLEQVHNRSPPKLECEMCLKRFKTTSHLGCHMRTEHYHIPYTRKRKNKKDELQSVY